MLNRYKVIRYALHADDNGYTVLQTRNRSKGI